MTTSNFYKNQKPQFFYRVDVLRNKTEEYAATLGGSLVFVGYTSNHPDIFFSRFLALTKAEILTNDQRFTNNGKGYIQVYLVNDEKWKDYLIYDSRGLTKKILKNHTKELSLLDKFIKDSKDVMSVQDENGEMHRRIRSHWKIPKKDSWFLEPISQDVLHIDGSDPVQWARLVSAQKQDAQLGVNRCYATYNYDLFKTKYVA